MKSLRFTLAALTALLVLIVCDVSAGDIKHAALEGSFKLVGRTYIDSTVKTAPEVIGIMSFTKTYRSLNVAWKDNKGTEYSYSLISKYTLTDTSYSETKLYSISNNVIGPGLKVDFASTTKTVPVKFENGKTTIALPFDPVTMVAEGDKLTCTTNTELGFVDSWFRVR